MAAETEFCLLGPLLVRHRGIVVPVPPGKQRALLVALLLSAGRLVTVDELTEVLWGASPPPSARAALHNCVMRLRKSLADVGPSRITTQPDGYLIGVGPGELDVERFESSLTAGREAARAGSWAAAAASLRNALTLWRGQPLSGVSSDVLALREVPRLAEMRLQAVEARIEADLHLGYHREVIPELRQLIAAHQLRERLHALLMIALYDDGQQAEALAAYQTARRTLLDELGTEPGQALRQMQRQILRADPSLEVQPAVAIGGRAGHAREGPGHQRDRVVPRHLPAAVSHFVGRGPELTALTSMLDQASDAHGTVVISAIAGTAGIGKTALAVHWAHLVAERFPDGQLYVDLRGYEPGQPMAAAAALAGFLRALGVPGQDVPAEPGERAARYRSLLASKRMLVILDNAGSAEQVRPLLPGTPACVVVVTSRDSLAGLVAREGAWRLDLDVLPLDEAVSLLRALIGGRVDADPRAAAVLAVQCARLPLALRVAAELVIARPAASLADMTDELADQQQRLDLLDASGDPRTALRAVFSWSYRYLDARAARAFRLLGLHHGPGLDTHAAAALANTTVELADRLLRVLACAHLVQPVGPRRYGMHDLLRAYGRELVADQDGEEERRAALTRLFDHYLHAAAAAMDTLAPAERYRRPHIPVPATPVPPLGEPAAARKWLDAERENLAAAAGYMTDHGWPSHATRLATILYRYYLVIAVNYSDALVVYTHALRAARQSGDRAAQADALMNRSTIDDRQGRHQQAASQLRQALAIYRELGDRHGQARALGNLGICLWGQARYQSSADHIQQALALARELGDQVSQAIQLGNLGLVLCRQGHYEQAADYHRQSLASWREIAHGPGEARALDGLGRVLSAQGRCREAAERHAQALGMFRELGDRDGEAEALNDLGAALCGQGQREQAADRHQQALAIFRELGNLPGETEALNGTGEALNALGQPGQARVQHHDALTLACQIGTRYEQARAHDGLARTYHGTGDLDQARRHWQYALTLYTDLDVPDAAKISAKLSTLPPSRYVTGSG